jgi:hypothetical protein
MKNRIIAALIIAAAGCTGAGESGTAKDDASRPAVVQTPAVVLPSDTAKPDTTEALQQRVNQAGHLMSTGYAAISAGMSFGDAKLAGSAFDSTAGFEAPGLKSVGSERIGAAIAAMGRRAGVKELKRGSMGLRFLPDSMVADSGIYTIVAQREGQPATQESGAYATTWRIKPSGAEWLIVRDRLYPAKPVKRPAR